MSETPSVTVDLASPDSEPTEPVAASLGRLFNEPITQMPEDLYIPPEALRVFLETFEGPLDLLLYLIRRQNLDILTINVATITHQYIEYVELMKAMEIGGIPVDGRYAG